MRRGRQPQDPMLNIQPTWLRIQRGRHRTTYASASLQMYRLLHVKEPIACFTSKNLSIASRQRLWIAHAKNLDCFNRRHQCLWWMLTSDTLHTSLDQHSHVWFLWSPHIRWTRGYLGQRIALASVSREPSWDYLIIIMIFILSMYLKSQSWLSLFYYDACYYNYGY